MSKWFETLGENSDIVISTRIRVARNIRKYPFPQKLDVKQKLEVAELVKKSIDSNYPNIYKFIKMKELTQDEAISLAERHLVSPEFVSCTDGRALILNEDESISIMLCEEDHIRIQVMLSGLELEKAYSISDEIDDVLDKDLGFAFDKNLGYLTQCPTNIGTALRASVILHLPALTVTNQISSLAMTVSKLGITLNGAFGEGSRPEGYQYQLSNQVTLGISEKAAIENLKSIALQLIAKEREAREQLLKDIRIEDEIWRSVGTLDNARILSFDEFMNDISNVRLGATAGLFEIPMQKINEMTILMQPATINASKGKRLDKYERDIIRAENVRNNLKVINK